MFRQMQFTDVLMALNEESIYTEQLMRFNAFESVLGRSLASYASLRAIFETTTLTPPAMTLV